MPDNRVVPPKPPAFQYGAAWIGIGAGTGMLFGMMMGQLGLGLTMGAALGVVLMAATSARSADSGVDVDEPESEDPR